MPTKTNKPVKSTLSRTYKKEVINDFYIAVLSREISLLGRKEVLSGKAKFGIFGAGKEIAQIALSKVFEKGDFRSGYYRDQTLALALGWSTPEQLFAQLYADTDPEREPHSFGRQMNAHYSTHSLDKNGEWKDLTRQFNSSADISPTAGQFPRAVGLALASKKYRELKSLKLDKRFSRKGNEVAHVTIGDASTSEGIFWESINAAGVMNVPMAVSIWDDGYGISVPTKYQTTKESIYEVLQGFQMDSEGRGYYMYQGKGWDYPGLCQMYREGLPKTRSTHNPVVFHVDQVTQPQGHSTSGSHERYKSKQRMQFEIEFDCISQMEKWILQEKISTEKELKEIRESAAERAKEGKANAWKAYRSDIKQELDVLLGHYDAISAAMDGADFIEAAIKNVKSLLNPVRKDLIESTKKVLTETRHVSEMSSRIALKDWLDSYMANLQHVYSDHLYSESKWNALKVPVTPVSYEKDSKSINGFEVLNTYFSALFEARGDVLAFGEDLGKIGDVNQGFAGLQEKFGEARIFDTGIREATIVGQGIGLAMRGFRPIAEIQYLDYFLYGFQTLVDDLATVRYRSGGRQKAPLIIRTRGHRLEGIWHTGSPMSMILNAVKGIYFLVPRNMVQAVGFYNTLLLSDEPGIVVECLNGYRLKEKLPSNLLEYTLPLGKVEVLQEGKDLTLVTYGSTLRVAQASVKRLEEFGISVELIDAQSLIPFDLDGDIVKSLQKTNRIVFLDEDVPGGATAFMMQQVLELQGGYRYLDSAPLSITAKAHRSAYGSDGDYFSKPNTESVFEAIYEMMHETDPQAYPIFF